MSPQLQQIQADERARGLCPELHSEAALKMPHPLSFYMDGQFYSWDDGLKVAEAKCSELVRDAKLNVNFWTWIDDLGERAWEVAK